MADHKFIKLAIEEPVAVLTIDNPPANALSTPVMKELEEVFDSCLADDSVRAVILTGAGMFFIAGADIREIDTIEDGATAALLSKEGQRVIYKLEHSSKPTIAAINGMCLGGGNELAMACHMRICSDRAQLGQPEITLGLIPGFGGTQRLPRLVGKAKALEMILTGDRISAKIALQIGLVNAVVPSGNVLKVAKGLAKKIAGLGAIAVAKSIEAVNEGMEVSLRDGLEIEARCFGEVLDTEDSHEGVRAFLEKRRPEFKGK